MPIYWMDAGVLIEAERGPYPRAHFPAFWLFIERECKAGRFRMPRLAFEEITKRGYQDALAQWCKSRKKMGLCINESKDAQYHYRRLAEYVAGQFAQQHVKVFLDGADGWVIAAALATNGSIVTSENTKTSKTKIKIPNVAKVFDVKCQNIFEVIRDLKPDL